MATPEPLGTAIASTDARRVPARSTSDVALPRARDVLFAAPCDLAAAEGLVAAYQGAVRAASTEVA